MESIQEKQKKAFDTLKSEFGYKNSMQSPRIEKVVVSTGTGSVIDKNKLEIIVDRLEKITGQKPSPRSARVSIASFKLREGDVVGYQVTLRGGYMRSFLDKLINIALPRMKDFQGLSIDSVDEMGNYTIGLKEHTVFPETSDEELKNIFGMAITVVTTASSKKEAQAFLKEIGFPFA